LGCIWKPGEAENEIRLPRKDGYGLGYDPLITYDAFILTGTVDQTTNYFDVGGTTNKPARYYRVRIVP
jgi:hypothetical protein